MLPTAPQLWFGEEGLVPGLGVGDINHREHLSGWHLELKGNTWQKGRTSRPGILGLWDQPLPHQEARAGNGASGVQAQAAPFAWVKVPARHLDCEEEKEAWREVGLWQVEDEGTILRLLFPWMEKPKAKFLSSPRQPARGWWGRIPTQICLTAELCLRLPLHPVLSSFGVFLPVLAPCSHPIAVSSPPFNCVLDSPSLLASVIYSLPPLPPFLFLFLFLSLSVSGYISLCFSFRLSLCLPACLPLSLHLHRSSILSLSMTVLYGPTSLLSTSISHPDCLSGSVSLSVHFHAPLLTTPRAQST